MYRSIHIYIYIYAFVQVRDGVEATVLYPLRNAYICVCVCIHLYRQVER